MAKVNKLEFSIYRYNPDDDKSVYMQDYTLEFDIEQNLMLLGALERIKDELDPTLSFRRSCREGVCGSDAMNINGKNGLACITPISSLPRKIAIRPLPGLPVVRDLVVDLEIFYKQYARVKPYLINRQPTPKKERLQSPEDRKKLNGHYECILCGACTTACPSFWWNPDKFVGPAGLLQANRFIVDSRDDAELERLQDLQDPFSVFRCRTIMNCVEVCPKKLNPTKAINNIKKEMLKIK